MMSVTGISGGTATNRLSAILQSIKSSSSGAQSAAATGSGSDSTQISGPAEFLGKLQQLKTEDPEAFKQLLQEMADKLESAADSATNERDKKMLATMAAKFSSVANGGDISELEPPKPPSGGMQIYAAESSSDGKMLGEMMAPQGPPPDAAGSESADSAENSSGETDSETDIRSLLKSLFDDLNAQLTSALSNES